MQLLKLLCSTGGPPSNDVRRLAHSRHKTEMKRYSRFYNHNKSVSERETDSNKFIFPLSHVDYRKTTNGNRAFSIGVPRTALQFRVKFRSIESENHNLWRIFFAKHSRMIRLIKKNANFHSDKWLTSFLLLCLLSAFPLFPFAAQNIKYNLSL